MFPWEVGCGGRMVRQDSATFFPSFCLAKEKCARDFFFCLELGPDSSLPLEWCRWARASAPAPWINFFLWEKVPEWSDCQAYAVRIKQWLTQCKGLISIFSSPSTFTLTLFLSLPFSLSVSSSLAEMLIHSFSPAPETTRGHSFSYLSLLGSLCVTGHLCPKSRANSHSQCHPHSAWCVSSRVPSHEAFPC